MGRRQRPGCCRAEALDRAGLSSGAAGSGLHLAPRNASNFCQTPGGGWSTAGQSTFTVGEGAPTGIGSLPSFLQGNFHRAMTPNGFTFIVNYAAGGGTFSAQIVTIAASGAGLQITVDNTTTNSISFPAQQVSVRAGWRRSLCLRFAPRRASRSASYYPRRL